MTADATPPGVDWRCECGDLNRDHEWCCYRCGAGRPEEEEARDALLAVPAPPTDEDKRTPR